MLEFPNAFNTNSAQMQTMGKREIKHKKKQLKCKKIDLEEWEKWSIQCAGKLFDKT